MHYLRDAAAVNAETLSSLLIPDGRTSIGERPSGLKRLERVSAFAA
jgi:hypothetical protein